MCWYKKKLSIRWFLSRKIKEQKPWWQHQYKQLYSKTCFIFLVHIIPSSVDSTWNVGEYFRFEGEEDGDAKIFVWAYHSAAGVSRDLSNFSQIEIRSLWNNHRDLFISRWNNMTNHITCTLYSAARPTAYITETNKKCFCDAEKYIPW